MGKKRRPVSHNELVFAIWSSMEDWFGPVGLHSNLDVMVGTESVKNNKVPAGTLLQDGNIFLQKRRRANCES
jgi:hypothetical protein